MTLEDDPIAETLRINRFLLASCATTYVDATPFILPARYDIYACPVIAVLFDLIPMRYPLDYFDSFEGKSFDAYVNGIARVKKADHVIAISEYVKAHALRYLGIARNRVSVVEPGLGPKYLTSTREPVPFSTSRGGIFCIQGAHRSKNFPAAVEFLGRLSLATPCDVDILAPTPSQRTSIESALDPGASRVRVVDSVREERKLAMQRGAWAIAHLSVDEGYGIPLAEALHLHCPVICLDTPVNRELMPGCDDPAAAGILLLDNLQLDSHATVETVAEFIRGAGSVDFRVPRHRIIEALAVRREQAGALLLAALITGKEHFDRWHAQAGLAIVSPMEMGSCGVSDYCLALMRSGSPRYVALLGVAPKDVQLIAGLRLVPFEALSEIPRRASGALFNLAISTSLSRGLDAIARDSVPMDVAVVHDAGSYLPGLLMQAAASGDQRSLFDRYLVDESDDVRALAHRWLGRTDRSASESAALFLEIDQLYRSNWLRAFRGRLVSHHSAFQAVSDSAGDGILGQLSPQSQIRIRSHYAPMPIDARASAGLARLSRKIRWALGLARTDFLACCAGSIVGGKYLDVVARVIAGLEDALDGVAQVGTLNLLLAGRVLDDALFAAIRAEFESRNVASRLIQIVEVNETRYDALLLASDVVIAFREQRRIQMSHSYVRALALGRPLVTNEQAGFDDADAAIICRDSQLERDLDAHLRRLQASNALRVELAAASQSHYRSRHTTDAFFGRIQELNDVVSAI